MQLHAFLAFLSGRLAGRAAGRQRARAAKLIADLKRLGVGARRAGGAPARAGRRPLRPLGLRALEFARGEEGPLRPREELACELRGTVNLIVGAAVYERCRTLAQAAPLIRARGRLERREGAVNVSVAELAALEWRRVLWKSSPSRHK